MIINIQFRKKNSSQLEADFFESTNIEEAIKELINVVQKYNRLDCLVINATIEEPQTVLLKNSKVPQIIKTNYSHILN